MTLTLAQLQEMRRRTFDTAYRLVESLGCRLYMSSHFIDRFNIRAREQTRALGAYELALRSLINQYEKARGEKAAVMISGHVFIFDLMQENQVRVVTFWVTDKSPEEALRGRGATLIAHQ